MRSHQPPAAASEARSTSATEEAKSDGSDIAGLVQRSAAFGDALQNPDVDDGEAAQRKVQRLRERLGKKELKRLRENIPMQRSPLYRPPAVTWVEKQLHPVLTLMGAYSQTAQMGKNADAVFRSIEEQSMQDTWFETLNLERTFATEHALLALHVWMVHRRFIIDYTEEGMFDGRENDRLLFDKFWLDSTWRIRNRAVREISVNKQLGDLQKATFVDYMEYDHGLAQNDDNMELSAAIFRGVFQSDENARLVDIIRLADHVRQEVGNLITQPPEDVYRGWITWSPALGETPEQRLERQREMLQGQWRERIGVDGKVFFHQTGTGEARRQIPDGLYRRRSVALTEHLQHLADAGEVPQELVNPNKLRSVAYIESGQEFTEEEAGQVVLPPLEGDEEAEAAALQHLEAMQQRRAERGSGLDTAADEESEKGVADK